MKTTRGSWIRWILCFALTSTAASAGGPDPQVATLVQVEGQVQIYHHPSDQIPPPEERKDGTLALFEGRYHRVAQARSGDRIEKDNVVRTLPGARARIIYDNGDQLYLGTATAYRVTWKEEGDRLARLNLMYGKLRGVISKEGPRKKLMIHTRAATMGVRGTDFFVSDTGPEGGTEVSVLRGVVEIQDMRGAKAEVLSGKSATIASGREIHLHALHQGQLRKMEETSDLPRISAGAPPFQDLERKAVQVTLKDIQLYQPETYRQLRSQLPEIERQGRVSELNQKALEVARRTAPPAPPQKKPSLKELESMDSKDYYDQYFKPAK
jgi:hypothetical protein